MIVSSIDDGFTRQLMHGRVCFVCSMIRFTRNRKLQL